MGNLDENHHFKSFDTREQALHKETSARAMGLATREGAATLNIGMATDDGKGLSLEEVLKALEETGAGVRGYRVAPSATEPTVVAYLNRTLDPEEAFKLSKDLRQQAIAEKFEGGADLYGPAAAAWRPFNEDFFLASRQPAPELSRSLDELEYLAKHYEEHKLWYEKFSAFLDSVLGANHEYKPLIMDFIAATSPGTNIGPNVRQAVDKLRQFMEEGTVTYHGLGHWPKSKLPNLGRAIRAEELQGPKVSPFSEALKGDPRSAAIDRHVAMVLFNTRKPTDAQIRVGQQAARDIAERLGWTPREVQAAWWAAGKEMFGAQPGERAKIVETYEQYLKEYQDELNAILTKDREGEARGLRAARAISERAGQRAGAARSVGGQSLGTRAGPEDLDKEQARHGYQPRTPEERGLPGETALSKLNKTEGGYWLSPSGRLYNVRAYGPTHYDYARDMMGVTMPEAFNKGWVRILTFSGDKTVYWDGNRANNLQIRTIRDVADTLGYSTYRDQNYTQRAALGLGTREEEGLGARAAEKPVLHPLIGSPLKLYKTTLAGRKFAPHFIRPAWDIVGMHRFYSSVARVFDKLPGVEYMGPAIRKNDDLLSKYRGEFHNRAATEFKKAPRHIMEEYKNYWINNQFRGRNFADNQPISPGPCSLVNLAKDLFQGDGRSRQGEDQDLRPCHQDLEALPTDG